MRLNFFYVIKETLIDEVIVYICKLTDFACTGRYENLSFEQLQKRVKDQGEIQLSADVGEDYVILYPRKARHSNLTARKLPKPPCLNGYNPKVDRIFGAYTTSQPPRFLIKATQKLG